MKIQFISGGGTGMREIILPIANPILKCYSKSAALSSVLATEEETIPWVIYSNLQIVYQPLLTKEGAMLYWFDTCNEISPFLLQEWVACPFLKNSNYTREFMECKWGTFSNFIVDNVDSVNYIYTMVNEKHIKAYEKERDSFHDLLINGYIGDMAVCHDFFSGIYKQLLIPLDELNESFSHLSGCTGIDDYLGGIFTWRLSDLPVFVGNPVCIPNKSDILKRMSSVLYPLSDSYTNQIKDKWPYELTFGIECYSAIIELIGEGLLSIYDLRPFHLLIDHV